MSLALPPSTHPTHRTPQLRTPMAPSAKAAAHEHRPSASQLSQGSVHPLARRHCPRRPQHLYNRGPQTSRTPAANRGAPDRYSLRATGGSEPQPRTLAAPREEARDGGHSAQPARPLTELPRASLSLTPQHMGNETCCSVPRLRNPCHRFPHSEV